MKLESLFVTFLDQHAKSSRFALEIGNIKTKKNFFNLRILRIVILIS